MPANSEPDMLERRTTARDWIGAVVRTPGSGRQSRPNGAEFHIFRAPGFRLTFAVTNGPKPPARAGLGRSVAWEFVKTVSGSGQRRIGFSDDEAKKAIAEKGYLLVKLNVG